MSEATAFRFSSTTPRPSHAYRACTPFMPVRHQRPGRPVGRRRGRPGVPVLWCFTRRFARPLREHRHTLGAVPVRHARLARWLDPPAATGVCQGCAYKADFQSARSGASSCRHVMDKRRTCAFAHSTVLGRPIRAARSRAVGLQNVCNTRQRQHTPSCTQVAGQVWGCGCLGCVAGTVAWPKV
jgi:hypothetical protein